MEYNKLLSACAAVLLTMGSFALVSPPAFGKGRTVVVVADPDVVTVSIGYADLNLASVGGERTLNGRVGRAINGLCSDATGGEDGYYVTNFAKRKCNKTTWSQARPQIANATQRARDIGLNGTSTIGATAITISLPE